MDTEILLLRHQITVLERQLAGQGDVRGLDVLLPHLAGVVVERVERTERGVLLWARVKADNGICPSCGGRSRRVHSR